MSIALNQEQLEFICQNVVKPVFNLGGQVFVFGSRATGTNQEFSDLDLLVVCDKVSTELRRSLASIEEFLEESNFPFKVDLVLETDLAKSYRNNIRKQLKPIGLDEVE